MLRLGCDWGCLQRSGERRVVRILRRELPTSNDLPDLTTEAFRLCCTYLIEYPFCIYITYCEVYNKKCTVVIDV